MGQCVDGVAAVHGVKKSKKRLSRRERVRQGIAKKKQRAVTKEEGDLTGFKVLLYYRRSCVEHFITSR